MSTNFHVIPAHKSIEDKGTLEYLKHTKLGKFYTLYLKKNNVIRSIVISCWQHGFPILLKLKFFLKGIGQKKYSKSIMRQGALVQDMLLAKYTLFQENTVKTPAPIVFPTQKTLKLISPHEQYVFPEIFLIEIGEVTVYGGSNLFIKNDLIVCHDLYDFKKDYTSEELHGRLIIRPKKETALNLVEDREPVSLEEAASFVDSCAPNYAHWITEVLPRIILFCSDPRFKNIPIIINDGLHKNLLDSLSRTIDDRDVICLPIGRVINVHKLYMLSPIGYVPFDKRFKKVNNFSHGKFSPDVLLLLKNRAMTIIGQQIISNPKILNEKIYIRRNSSVRKLTNLDEIEHYLVDQGFSIVEPEKLTFLEQVSVFAHAKIIVGGSGAAFANLIFCHANTKIVIFLPDIVGTSFWYWQNMACAVGNKVEYVLGDVESKRAGIHSNYKLSLNDLASAIE